MNRQSGHRGVQFSAHAIALSKKPLIVVSFIVKLTPNTLTLGAADTCEVGLCSVHTLFRMQFHQRVAFAEESRVAARGPKPSSAAEILRLILRRNSDVR